MIALGQMARDVITGFSGLVMAKAQYLTGCNQVLLTPRKLDKDGKRRDGEWFDEQRVERVGKEAVKLPTLETRDPGADEPLPPGR